MRGYFASCVVFLSPEGAKCPRVLYVKPLNERFIIPLEKILSKFGFPVLLPENLGNLDFAGQYIILLCNTMAYFARSLDLIW